MNKKVVTAVRFEFTPFRTGALDRSATLPLTRTISFIVHFLFCSIFRRGRKKNKNEIYGIDKIIKECVDGFFTSMKEKTLIRIAE